MKVFVVVCLCFVGCKRDPLLMGKYGASMEAKGIVERELGRGATFDDFNEYTITGNDVLCMIHGRVYFKNDSGKRMQDEFCLAISKGEGDWALEYIQFRSKLPPHNKKLFDQQMNVL